MAFRLFLLCTFVLLARPQDVFTFLQPLRPALLVTLLSLAALMFGSRRQGHALALSTPETKRYLLFVLIMVIGIPFAYHKGLAFESVVFGYAVNVCFFILLVSQVTSLQKLKDLIWVICLATAVYSVLGGLLQVASFEGGRFQFQGGAFDPNDTAYVLLALFPLSLYFLRFDEGRLKMLVVIAVVCGAIASILLTGSRGGLLAFAVVLLLMLATRKGGLAKGHKLLLVLALASAWLLLKDKIQIERYMTLSDIALDYNTSAEGGRIALWGQAIELSLANPVTGVGVECYAFASDLARRDAGETYLRWHAVHNSYLQVAAEVGLPGFAIYALIYLRSFATFIRLAGGRARRRSRESDELGALSGLMLLGFTGLAIAGFFLSQGYSIFATLYFALAASLERIQAKPSVSLEPSREAPDVPDRIRSSGWPAR